MANRHLLHKSRLDEFREWLIAEGWQIYPCRDCYEVLRALSPKKKWFIAYRKTEVKEHYTVRDEDMSVLRRFLRRSSNESN